MSAASQSASKASSASKKGISRPTGSAHREKSQHFLKNHGLIDTILIRAKIRPTDTVLEIGAGTGSITTKLLPKAHRVVAYEPDSRLIRELLQNVAPELKPRLEVIQQSVLAGPLPHFDLCVSNIPFHISLPIVMRLIRHDFRAAYILVQKEFAARLTARAGSESYSRLSVMCQLLAHVEHIAKVSRNSFAPPPRVDCCFIKIEPRIPRPPIDVEEFDNLLKQCFGRKNKTLAGNLKSAGLEERLEEAALGASALDEILEAAGLTDARTAKMEVEDFLRLLLEFKKRGIHF